MYKAYRPSYHSTLGLENDKEEGPENRKQVNVLYSGGDKTKGERVLVGPEPGMQFSTPKPRLIYPSIYLSIYLSISIYLYLSIYLSI